MTLDAVLESWKMGFSSVHFLLFLPVAVGATFLLPQRLRRVWLLLASYYFYFFAAPRYLPVLLCGTLFSYGAALGIGGAKSGGAKRAWLAFGALGMLLGLTFFKYNPLYAQLLGGLGLCWDTGFFTTAGAVGISFYTFTGLGYLIDLYRGDVPLEKRFVSHALLLGFFPSVVQGPISRAGDLLPQLNDLPPRFDAAGAATALRRMALGFFKKLAVADTLALFVDHVYGKGGADLAGHSGLTLTLAAVVFSFQLYFDFAGYTDIALGAAGLLGVRLPENFNTPYFATNFSSFWSRWHMSLSAWLQDYIFTPLVWSRWPEKLPVIGKRVQKPPMLTSIAAVFLVSGLWHGDTLCFLVWGALQGVYRIGEEVLHRTLGKPKKRPPLWARWGKRAVVFVLWTGSLVFFKTGLAGGSVPTALSALWRQFSFVPLAETGRAVYDAIAPKFYGYDFMVALFLVFTLVCLGFALWGDWMQFARLKGRHPAVALAEVRPALRWCVYIALVLCCFGGFLLISGGFGGTNFLYQGF